MAIELIQGDRVERGSTIELGSGLTLQQTADGIPEIVGGAGGAAAIEFTSTDLDGPTFDEYSIGVRIGLWDQDQDADDAGHAIGVDTGVVWYGVGSVANAHRWYGGETLWAQLHVQAMDNPKLIIGNLTLPPASTLPETSIMGLSVKVRSTDSGGAHELGAHVYAEQTVANPFSIQGFETYVRSIHTSGTLALSLGLIGNVEHDGAGGTVSEMYSVAGGVIVRAGTVTKAAAVAAGPIFRPGGTITEGIGLLIRDITEGTTRWQLKSEGTAGSLFSGPVHSRVGTDGSTSDSHLLWGKLSSPASGNPEYRLRTDASAQALTIIDGYNGTTALTFAQLDYANNRLWLHNNTGEVHSLAPIKIVPGTGSEVWLELDMPATTPGLIRYTRAGTFRWRVGADGVAESGSNAGNNFAVFRYNDAGSFQGTSIAITRSTGAVVLEGSLAWGSGSAIASSNGVVQTSRTITATSPITGGGDLSANRTIGIDASLFSTSIVTTATPGVVINVASGAALYRCSESANIRWQFGSDGSGSGGGDRFVLFSYNDAGSFVQNPFMAERSGADPIWLQVNSTLKNVTEGATDSAGSGFKWLRVPN